MAAVFLYLRNQNRRRRVPHVFRDRRNPLDFLSDEEIRMQYRLTRICILELCALLQNELERPTRRCFSLPVSLQVLIALRYLASGSFQAVIGDVHGVSQPTVSTVVYKFVNSLCIYKNNYIIFPQDDQSQRDIKMDFYQIAEMPNVLGALDGTLIPIQGPTVNEPVKGFMLSTCKEYVMLKCYSQMLWSSGLAELMTHLFGMNVKLTENLKQMKLVVDICWGTVATLSDLGFLPRFSILEIAGKNVTTEHKELLDH